VKAKTSHAFEAIVYFQHYVIGIHKFVLKCRASSKATALYLSVSDLNAFCHLDYPRQIRLTRRAGLLRAQAF